MLRWFPVLSLLCAIVFAQGPVSAQSDTLKVAFIYVGPVGDYGFSYAHDLGRQALEEAIPEVETVYVESVPEAEVEPFIDQLVADGADVVIATSFGYGDGVLAAAARYPDVIFGHATGVQRAPNVMTFMADFYQVYYLNGLIAGALSDSGDIGYVAAFPIPEVKRHINAFAIGAQEVNPEATVDVRWLYSWFDPAGAKEATEALMAQGADVFAFTEDTPTVIQTAASKGYPSYSHYASMLEFSPETVVSGQIVHWQTILIDFIQGVLDGEYTNQNLQDVDYFWLLAEGAVELGAQPGMPINPLFEEELKSRLLDHPEFGQISAWDLVFRRLEQMATRPVEFDPFQGPISDRQGNLIHGEGERPSLADLLSMQWAAENVVGPWESEP
jgi:basic membrane protein A